VNPVQSPSPEALVSDYQAGLPALVRRGQGTYFTPPWLARLLARETLAPWRTADPDRVLALRIIDPAAGAGALLVAAARELASWLPWPEPEALRAVVARCLTGWDVDPAAVAAARQALGLLVGGALPSAALAEVVQVRDALSPGEPAARWHAVVSNPPWGVRLEGAALDRWRGVVGRRRPDSFEAFVHLVPALLSSEPPGRYGLILPEIVLLRDYERTRRFILAHLPPAIVAESGHCFPGVNMGAAVLVGSTAGGEAVTFATAGEGGLTRESTVAASTLAAQPAARFNRLMTPRVVEWLAALHEVSQPLSRVLTLREGIHSGNARRQVFVAEPAAGRERLVVRHRPDGSARLPWDGHYFDAAAYAALAPPLYARATGLDRHRGPKLAIPRTVPHITAYLDDTGLLLSNNFFVATADDLLPAWVWLNSRLATLVWRLTFPRDPRLFPELKINHLNDLPLPPITRSACLPLGDFRGTMADLRARCDAVVAAALPVDLVAEAAILAERLSVT
jgi:hypothetical protein